MRKVRVTALVGVLALTALAVLGDAQGQSCTLTQTIPNPAPDADDQFGRSVAAVGGNILVGAYGDDPGGVAEAGSAYLFDGTTGALLLTLPNPAPAAGDLFGDPVAAVGENILVGAHLDDPGGVGEAGSAYLFDGTTGALLLTIPNPAPAADDWFGVSVAALGGNILVGAFDNNPGGVTHAGSVYLFDGTTGALLLTIPDPTPGAHDQFGGSVAAVGGNILVGAIGDDPGGVPYAGSAYLFDGTTGALLQTIPNPTPADGDYFGASVAALGGNILVGAWRDDPGGVADAGSAYLFSGSTGALLLTIPNPAPATGDAFGQSVAAVSGNVLVGAWGDDPGGVADTGSAYLFATVYSFSGFFGPVDNAGTLNLAKAGSAIPVKFSLSGNQGLSIFATGYPGSQRINCDMSALLDPIEETVTAGSSSLSYDPMADRYVYVWKTDKAWAGTCRQLIVRLNDGTDHVAKFKFK